MNIYVGNLSFKTTEEELKHAFESFGEVTSTRIITDGYTGKSKGFGFVEMPNAAEAKAAIDGLNGKELGGYLLKVNEARPREDRRSRGGGGGGHFGGRGRGGGGGGGGRRPY
ncbi:MAG: RNA-binding protein [Deltaproteobacteria bacterium]|nr:RNA-binding protein [Deltaproteobacteria bacterium]